MQRFNLTHWLFIALCALSLAAMVLLHTSKSKASPISTPFTGEEAREYNEDQKGITTMMRHRCRDLVLTIKPIEGSHDQQVLHCLHALHFAYNRGVDSGYDAGSQYMAAITMNFLKNAGLKDEFMEYLNTQQQRSQQ